MADPGGGLIFKPKKKLGGGLPLLYVRVGWGGARPPPPPPHRPPLFLNHTEALRAEKKIGGGGLPPLYVRSLFKVWIRHCLGVNFREKTV